MKKLKKISCAFLALCILFCLWPVQAADTPTLRIVNASAPHGDSVTVAVEIVNNPGLITALVQISYDPNVLTLKSATDGGLLGTNTFMPGGKLSEVPFKVLWADSLATANHTADGTLVTFTFDVKENAPVGSTPITLEYTRNSCVNVDLVPVTFATESGSVTVTHQYNQTALKEPTCTESGVRTTVCAGCGDTITETLQATGHHFGQWITVTEPTATKDGLQKRTCPDCSTSESKVIPAPTTLELVRYTANRTVDYRTTLTFRAEVKNPVDGYAIHWFVDGKDMDQGDSYTVKEAKKDYTILAKYMNGDTVELETPVEKVTVKNGFFDKLKAFFRGLFRKLPVLIQSYMELEKVL